MTEPLLVMTFLHPYCLYGRFLRQVTHNAIPAHDRPFHQLMGIEVSQEGSSFPSTDHMADLTSVSIHPRSFVYRWAAFQSRPQYGASPQPSPESGIQTGLPLAEKYVRRALLLRLNSLLSSLHLSAMKCGAFQLCPQYIATGRCPRNENGNCRYSHPNVAALSIQEFNMRLAIHLSLIEALDSHAAVADEGYNEERSRKAMQG